MDKKNRLLAKILTAALCMSMIPTTAWAAAATLIQAPTLVFQEVYNFDETNIALARDTEGKDVAVTIQNGKVVTAPITYAANTNYEVYRDEATSLYGFKDGAGNVAVPAAYDRLDLWRFDESDLYIPACKGEKWGLIDRTGKVILDFTYDSLIAQPGTVAQFSATLGENTGIIDQTGKVLVPLIYANVNFLETRKDGVSLYSAHAKRENQGSMIDAGGTGLLGIIDSTGKVLLPLIYNDISEFSEGLTTFTKYPSSPEETATCGVMDIYGTIFPTDPDYFFINGFSNGMARVSKKDAEKNNLVGFIDATGKEVIPCTFRDASSFTAQGFSAVVNKESQHALINKSGAIIVDYGRYDSFGGYDAMEQTGDTLIQVSKLVAPDSWESLCGYIDISGNEVIPCTFESGRAFSNGLAVVSTEMGTGIIDRAGNFVLPAIYAAVGSYALDPALFVSDYVWVRTADEDYNYKFGVAKIDRNAAATPPAVPTAYAVTTPVLVDGKQVTFDVYALKDAAGNDTNYFKLRDVASALNGTAAQFDVGWDGAVTITGGSAYTPNGTEGTTPFSGNQPVSNIKPVTNVINGAPRPNAAPVKLQTVTLVDATGSGYTYYQIRNLGEALGFNVKWDNTVKSIVIETSLPYTGK